MGEGRRAVTLRGRLLAAAHALLAASVFAMPSVGAPAQEYQLKAVFLFQFAQFVEWPSSSFASPEMPFEFCVLGEDPFGSFLEETVRDENVKGRALTIRRHRQPEELQGCNILFISRSQMDRLDTILAAVRGRSTLTVADAQAFAERGGAIQFVTVNNKLRLRINPNAAKAADLVISSKLLSLADIVNGQGP